LKVARRIRGEACAATDAVADVVDAALKVAGGAIEAAPEIVRTRGEPEEDDDRDEGEGEGEGEGAHPHAKAGARPALVVAKEVARILKDALGGTSSNLKGGAVGAAAAAAG
jgi:hypothetical protein